MTSQRSRSKRNPKSPTPARIRRSLFDFRPLLEGEDAAAYDELIRHIRKAVNPVDFIEEIYVADVVSSEWEVIRWRRLKFRLMQARMHEALRKFLKRHLDYDTYREAFAEFLAEILQESCRKNLPEEQARGLAYQCANSQQEAVEKVTRLLNAADLDIERIQNDAKDYTAKELVQKNARREADSVQLIDQLLESEGRTREDIMIGTLLEKMDEIERIDRQIAIAEAGRNTSLREIDRRRAVLGEALRRTLPEVELKVIETTASRDNEST